MLIKSSTHVELYHLAFSQAIRLQNYIPGFIIISLESVAKARALSIFRMILEVHYAFAIGANTESISIDS